jgi:hypothetical protein
MMADIARSQRMTLRNCRPLVVLAALALSACPFKFKYNVENGAAEAVALRAGDGIAVGPSVAGCSFRADQPAACEPSARRPPGG